jgi:hypothetical protein
MKIYVTKYALSVGILEVDAEISTSVAAYRGGSGFINYIHKGEWFYELDAALQKCEELRIKKLQSLDKQIKKISALKFEVKRID